MLLQNPFAALSPTGIDSCVLTVITGADAVFTPQRVHQLLPSGGSLSAVRHSLSRLASMGIITEHSIGRSLGYSLNKEHLLAPAIHAIRAARHELLERIRTRVTAWDTDVTCILFGSAARNEMNTESDIDLLFLVHRPSDALDSAISELCDDIFTWCGNSANALVLMRDDVDDEALIREILDEGIALTGSLSELTAMAGGHRDESKVRQKQED